MPCETNRQIRAEVDLVVGDLELLTGKSVPLSAPQPVEPLALRAEVESVLQDLSMLIRMKRGHDVEVG